MTYNIFLIILLSSLFSCFYQSIIWTDVRFINQNQLTKLNMSNLSQYCTRPGIQCADCETSILCRFIEGKYTAIIFENCTAPKTCDEGLCTSIPNNQCTKQEYKCQSVEGMYPDPGSCQTFHYCVPKDGVLEHVESKCDVDYYYNPLTTYCDKKLSTNKICPVSYVPKCIKPAQTGAIKENPVIYYICMSLPPDKLYPVLDACKYGKIYDANTYSCK